MKIAKKVLALAMAVAMIASLSAMAFAASIAKDDAKFELVLDGTDVLLYANNCEGLAAANLVFEFDDTVVEKVRFTSGADAKNVNGDNFENNAFTDEKNTSNLAAVEYGFYFKATLWTTEQFAAEDFSEEANINGAKFHVTTIKVTLADGKTAEDLVVKAKASVSFSNGLEGDAKVEEAIESFPINSIEKKEEETTKKEEATTKKEEATTKKEEATTKPVTPEKETDKGNTGNNKPMGDTGLLAIAAGVVAVAGAAFVVTKKRK